MPITINFVPSVTALVFVQEGYINSKGKLVLNPKVTGYVQ